MNCYFAGGQVTIFVRGDIAERIVEKITEDNLFLIVAIRKRLFL
jgi:hypothetical protein